MGIRMLVFPLREAEMLEPKTLKLTYVLNAITETGSNAKGTVVEAQKCHAFILDIPLPELYVLLLYVLVGI